MNEKNTTSKTEVTPPVVLAEIGLLKALIKKQMSSKGNQLLGLRVHYSNFFATTQSEFYKNNGLPVVYIRFSHATYLDGTPVPATDVEEAVKYAQQVMGDDCLPISYEDEGLTLKVVTASLYDKEQVRHRPSAKLLAVEENK